MSACRIGWISISFILALLRSHRANAWLTQKLLSIWLFASVAPDQNPDRAFDPWWPRPRPGAALEMHRTPAARLIMPARILIAQT
jgi:hypothetical protein